MINLSSPGILTAVFFVSLGVTFDAGAAETIRPMHRVDLFDGKDLAGWKSVVREGDASRTWQVRDGVITCAGKPTGYLRTDRPYRDYRLTVEWRFTRMAPKADNTGVLVHIQSPDQVWPPCVQCQGKHTRQGDVFVMSGVECKEHRGMNANTPVPMKSESSEKPVGEWNTCEMVCQGNTVQVYINGTRMNQVTDCTVSSGFIGFQAEGAELEIRAVYLTPLKKP